MIRFSDFSFTYKGQKNPALKHIDLTIEDGEKVLICGPSGSGKSTIGNCINGLIPNSLDGRIEGEASICGHDLSSSDINAISKNVGTVLQDTDGQFVGITVAEDIAFALENNEVACSEIKLEVEKAAGQVSMDKFLDHKPQELSGGQKQRVSIAGVLIQDTDVLLFDEPLANLDPATGRVAIELIDEIHQKYNKTIIIIEHRLEDVLHRHIDRVVLIDGGEVAFNGSVNELLKSNILIEKGIREPLYLSAMKKADIDFSEDDVSSIDDLDVSKYRDGLREWVSSSEAKRSNESSKEILRLENVSYSYDGINKVLDDVSLTLHEGEMVSLLGNNGAGKSTLSSLCMGLMAPDKGKIYIDGKDATLDTIFQRSESVGFVMQNPNYMISQTLVFDEVAFGLRKRGVEEAEVKTIVTEILTLCGLERKAKWPISALSYGQKKRVTIASILVMKPRLLILDEPTAGQDFYHYTRLMEFIRHLRDKLSLTILFVTHDMHLSLEYTPRAIVLSSGRIIADDKIENIFSDADILKRANLNQTSLYKISKAASIDPSEFISAFIKDEGEKEAEAKERVSLDYKLHYKDKGTKKRRVKNVKEGSRKLKFGLSYIPMDSSIHRLSGVTKFLFLFLWVCMCFSTFDLRILCTAAILSWVLMKLSKIPMKVFRPFLIAMVLISLNNALFIYLFAPGQGTAYMGTRTVLLGPENAHYALTLETLWYLIVVCMKYLTIFPASLIFVSATQPSEFASSLNRIKVSYKVSYAVSLALRYLPDVIGDYGHIANAQMCRGVDLSSNASLKDRVKSVGSIMAPLIMTSLDKIDVITNALVLRGFGKRKKRTWYNTDPMRKGDYFLLLLVIVIFIIALYMRFGIGTMFWKPF